LVVGFCTSLSAGNLRATLLDFKSRFPQVEFETIERSKIRLAAALRNGVIDVQIIAGEELSFDFKSAALWGERVLVVLRRRHRTSRPKEAFR
jgi:DNA-binding transcriptional LysR family regulator